MDREEKSMPTEFETLLVSRGIPQQKNYGSPITAAICWVMTYRLVHFGYPYCHGGTIPDPEFGKKVKCDEFIAPAQNLGPHVAALGLKFCTGTMFPESYRNNLFIAEHGSWNRSKKIGYRVSLVKVEGNKKAVSYETFASGWLDDTTQKAWGRPADVLMLPDGSMLVSDDQANVVYRISYKK
jgi:glucose/arabinose dehydrogenase